MGARKKGSGCGRKRAGGAAKKRATTATTAAARKASGVLNWEKHEKLSAKWCAESARYAEAINRFVEVGLTKGWDEAGEQPRDRRTKKLADDVLDVVIEANRAGGDAWRELRRRFPPAQEPFIPLLQKRAVSVSEVVYLGDDEIATRVGTTYSSYAIVRHRADGSVRTWPETVAVARSADRRWFARMTSTSIEVREGSVDADRIARELKVPDGTEGLPWLGPADAAGTLESLTLFPDGKRALVVRDDGVFACDETRVTRLCPTPEESAAMDADDRESSPSYPMVHGAVSVDGAWVAWGHQSSQHMVSTPAGDVVAQFGPFGSEYPHHAAFAPDGGSAIFNSCHFYNGVTLSVDTAKLRGLKLEAYEGDARLCVIEDVARVYASTFFDGCWVLGDAGGYLRAVSPQGERRWQHHCGSTIGGIDVSPSGKQLCVATAAGFVQFLDVVDGAEKRDRYQIGNANLVERMRFVHWKGTPLLRW